MTVCLYSIEETSPKVDVPSVPRSPFIMTLLRSRKYGRCKIAPNSRMDDTVLRLLVTCGDLCGQETAGDKKKVTEHSIYLHDFHHEEPC
jgi:hypothetical protein